MTGDAARTRRSSIALSDSAAPITNCNALIHELHLGRLANAAGFSVVGVRKNNVPYALEGSRGTIAAGPLAAGAPLLAGVRSLISSSTSGMRTIAFIRSGSLRQAQPVPGPTRLILFARTR